VIVYGDPVREGVAVPEPVRQRTGAHGLVVRVRHNENPPIRESAGFPPTPVPSGHCRAHVSIGTPFAD